MYAEDTNMHNTHLSSGGQATIVLHLGIGQHYFYIWGQTTIYWVSYNVMWYAAVGQWYRDWIPTISSIGNPITSVNGKIAHLNSTTVVLVMNGHPRTRQKCPYIAGGCSSEGRIGTFK